ncbi:MAG: sodium:proton antiporter [Rhodobacteraceae bacterium]|nr:MAG: sodium:proton antiporter [Paracoccaceae bacterium]
MPVSTRVGASALRRAVWPWLSAAAFRALLAVGLWGVVAGLRIEDWPGAAVGVIGATLVSLALTPPSPRRLRPVAALRVAARFLRLSVIGGLDVGWRALHPRMPMRPRLSARRSALAPGPARDLMRAFTSAVPGVLACGVRDDGALILHCLDGEAEDDAALDVDERLIACALGSGPRDGGV